MIKIGNENYNGVLNGNTKKTAEADLFSRILEEKQKSKAEGSQNGEAGAEAEASQTQSNIIVRPDGSRVLVITTGLAGAEMTMNIKISDATEFPNQVSVSGEELNNIVNNGGVK